MSCWMSGRHYAAEGRRQKADCGYPPSKSARSLNYRTGILGSYKRIIMYKRTPDAQKIYEIQKIFKAQRILKYR